MATLNTVNIILIKEDGNNFERVYYISKVIGDHELNYILGLKE